MKHFLMPMLSHVVHKGKKERSSACSHEHEHTHNTSLSRQVIINIVGAVIVAMENTSAESNRESRFSHRNRIVQKRGATNRPALQHGH